MNRCNRCLGFVPPAVTQCPNCHCGKRAWWTTPLAALGAGFTAVTLSACYGLPCVAGAQIKLPDGGTQEGCLESYDCLDAGTAPDGGDVRETSKWKYNCLGTLGGEVIAPDGGVDGG
ncbi:MAG: hypothetical protein K1X64_20875 [Myxococcaceae bacterium]|nr:hypothetical protein [Myxococcaceae bacterium]